MTVGTDMSLRVKQKEIDRWDPSDRERKKERGAERWGLPFIESKREREE